MGIVALNVHAALSRDEWFDDHVCRQEKFMFVAI
jgi:hypothetical protein